MHDMIWFKIRMITNLHASVHKTWHPHIQFLCFWVTLLFLVFLFLSVMASTHLFRPTALSYLWIFYLWRCSCHVNSTWFSKMKVLTTIWWWQVYFALLSIVLLSSCFTFLGFPVLKMFCLVFYFALAFTNMKSSI